MPPKGRKGGKAGKKPKAPRRKKPLEPEVLSPPPVDTTASGPATTGVTGPVVDIGEVPSGALSRPTSSPTLPVVRSAEGVARIGPLQAFLREVGRYPLLSADEEMELATAVYEQGDPRAAQKLAVHNLRLVVKMAYRYRRAWASMLDLIQEGNVGLIEAVRRFDPHKGARFSTYAAYWIRAYMIRFLLDHSRMVRISRTRAGRKMFFRLSREREKLRALGIEAGPKLLAETLGVSEKDFNEVAMHMDQAEVRLDAPLSVEGDGGTVLDMMSNDTESPESAAHRRAFADDVSSALESFAQGLTDEREKRAWTEHLMSEDPTSLAALGAEFGVTKQRMGQIVNGIRKRLKVHLVEVLGPEVELGYTLDEG